MFPYYRYLYETIAVLCNYIFLLNKLATDTWSIRELAATTKWNTTKYKEVKKSSEKANLTCLSPEALKLGAGFVARCSREIAVECGRVALWKERFLASKLAEDSDDDHISQGINWAREVPVYYLYLWQKSIEMTAAYW